MDYISSIRDIDRRKVEDIVKDIIRNEDMEHEVMDQRSRGKSPMDPSASSNEIDLTNFIKGIDSRFIMKHVQDELTGITVADEVTGEDVYDLILTYIWSQVEDEYGFNPGD